MNSSNLYKSRCNYCQLELKPPYISESTNDYHISCHRKLEKERIHAQEAISARDNAGVEVLTEDEWNSYKS